MTKPLHVLRITQRLYCPGNWATVYGLIGGVPIQAWNLSNEIGKSGISQTILTGNFRGYPKHREHVDSIIVQSLGMRIPQFLVPKVSGIFWIFPAVWHLLKSRKNYDLVHIHFNDGIACRLLSLTAQFLKLPVVLSLNTELWCKSRIRKYICKRSFNIIEWIESKSIRKADQIITLTTHSAEYWSTKLSQNRNNTKVIPDGC